MLVMCNITNFCCHFLRNVVYCFENPFSVGERSDTTMTKHIRQGVMYLLGALSAGGLLGLLLQPTALGLAIPTVAAVLVFILCRAVFKSRSPETSLLFLCYAVLTLQRRLRLKLTAGFLTVWGRSGLAERAASLAGMSREQLLTALAAVLYLTAIGDISLLLAAGLSTAKSHLRNRFCTLSREEWKQPLTSFILLFAMNLAGITAILRANFNYWDDMGRAAEGYKGWEDFSRYVSYHLSTLIHGNSYLTDVSPIPQVLAAAVIALASLVLLRVLIGSWQLSLFRAAAVLPVGLSPYFLSCYSYKFDAPYMALSVLFGVLPLLARKHKVHYLWLTAVCTVLMCCSYQASSGIFPMAVCLLVLLDWQKGSSPKELLYFAGCSAGAYLAGMLVFLLGIHRFNPAASYRSSSLLPLDQLFLGALKNYGRFYSAVLRDFHPLWLTVILFLLIAFAVFPTAGACHQGMLSCGAAGLTAVLMLFLSVGVYPWLTDAMIEARSLYGVGVMIAMLQVVLVSRPGVGQEKWLTLALGWMFFVFAFTYGNGLAAQKQYTDFRIREVIETLNDRELLPEGKRPTIQFSGSIGLAPSLRQPAEEYPVLERLIPPGLAQDGWGMYTFSHYYGLDQAFAVNVAGMGSLDLREMELPALYRNPYHTIYGDADNLLIELH